MLNTNTITTNENKPIKILTPNGTIKTNADATTKNKPTKASKTTADKTIEIKSHDTTYFEAKQQSKIALLSKLNSFIYKIQDGDIIRKKYATLKREDFFSEMAFRGFIKLCQQPHA